MERRVQKTVIAAQAQELGLGVQDIADDSIARAELGLPLTNEPALTMDVNPFLSHNFSKKGSLNRHTDDNDGTVAQRSRDIKFSKVHKSAKGQLGANAIQPSLVTNKYSVGLNASYIKKYWDEFEEIVFEPAYCYQHPHGFVFQHELSCKTYGISLVDTTTELKRRPAGSIGAKMFNKHGPLPVTVIPTYSEDISLLVQSLAVDGLCVAAFARSRYSKVKPKIAIVRIFPTENTIMKMIAATRARTTRIWHLNDTSIFKSEYLWSKLHPKGTSKGRKLYVILTTNISHAINKLTRPFHRKGLAPVFSLLPPVAIGLACVPARFHNGSYVRKLGEDVSRVMYQNHFGFKSADFGKERKI